MLSFDRMFVYQGCSNRFTNEKYVERGEIVRERERGGGRGEKRDIKKQRNAVERIRTI